MSGKTRDWLTFGTLVAIAFALGLAFAAAFKLPTRGEAAVRSVLQDTRRPVPQAKAAVDLGDAFASVAEHVKPAVVYIRSERRERTANRRLPPGFEDFFQGPRRPQVEQGSGSGFIVSQDGYILTNNHVVQGADRVTVRLYDNREFAATTIGTDPATDVAVIKIQTTSLPTVRLGDADSSDIGNWVLAIGNPLGEAFTFTVTAGIISAKGRLLAGLNQSRYAIQDFIQTDAAINPGNSGGPLVNVRGEVIGINSAIASETGFYAGYGFAIPINLARTVMTQIIATGHVERAVMGVMIKDATQEDADAVGLSAIKGVVVRDYSFGERPEESPARRAGIQQGDVIVSVDGQPVTSVPQLQQRVGFKKPGDVVRVTIVRSKGQQQAIPVKLAAPPGADDDEIASNVDSQRRDEPASPVGPLGISVQPLTQEDIRDTELRPVLRSGGALVVTQVSPDGPAYQKLADASSGYPDIILKVNGAPTRTVTEFRTAIGSLKKGDIATLSVLRRTSDGWLGDVVRIRVP
ncbi:MAG TPA: Do family serine endopeptidase [Gemmatimonadales bacterium]|nr:Do family serine endopeptidase [Gemmatimonadales bacterium]